MKRLLALVLCGALTLGLCACGAERAEEPGDLAQRTLCLCVGDSYDFAAMELRLDNLGGTALYAVGDTITATAEGTDWVRASDAQGAQYRFTVTVYADAAALGGSFPLDRGMFQGKKVIAFGDSITDGCLLDSTKPGGLNYEDTYFAKLCAYLGAASDPTDLENCNFACGGTTLAYGTNGYGISGVERVSRTEPFTDAGRVRNPYPNVRDADLCVIFYGTNDLTAGVAAENAGGTDTPSRAQDALTIRGGMYYMLRTLHRINPRLKILVLPPLYRRADGYLLVYSADKTDVCNPFTHASLKQYGETMAAVCRENGAKFIDWYGVFDYASFGADGASTYSADGLHPNVAGHRRMYDFLVQSASQEARDNETEGTQ